MFYPKRPKPRRPTSVGAVQTAVYLVPGKDAMSVQTGVRGAKITTVFQGLPAAECKVTLREFRQQSRVAKRSVFADVKTDHHSRKLMRLAELRDGVKVNIQSHIERSIATGEPLPEVVTATISGANPERIIFWTFFVGGLREDYYARQMTCSGAGEVRKPSLPDRSDEQKKEETATSKRHKGHKHFSEVKLCTIRTERDEVLADRIRETHGGKKQWGGKPAPRVR